MTRNILGSWSGWSVRLVLRGEQIVSKRHIENDPLVVFVRDPKGPHAGLDVVVRRYRLTQLLGLSREERTRPDGGIVLDLDRAGELGPEAPGVGLPGHELCAVLRCAVLTLSEWAAQGRNPLT